MEKLFYSSFMIQSLGVFITFILFYLIKTILHASGRPTDFIRGDNGTYSLSRFQALLWGFVIVSYQVSVILTCAIFNDGKYGIDDYRLVFSPEILGLLALSYGSFLIVKGSTDDLLNKGMLNIQPNRKGRWSDLISGTDGSLDLSRFQMLIWTILAIVVFSAQVHMFLFKLHDLKPDKERASELFMNTEERKSYNQSKGTNNPKIQDAEDEIPTVSWSFIVLMGLSQSVYIGKKFFNNPMTGSISGKVNMPDDIAKANLAGQSLKVFLSGNNIPAPLEYICNNGEYVFVNLPLDTQYNIKIDTEGNNIKYTGTISPPILTKENSKVENANIQLNKV